jgi:hypothetical protein
MTGDYSDLGAGQTIFFYQPPSDKKFFAHRMIIWIKDAGNPDADKYGNNITLANGIQVRIQNDSGTVNALTKSNVKTNGEWAVLCYDVKELAFGVGDVMIVVRWSFDRAGIPLSIYGLENERLEVVLNDDFSDLTGHRMMVQGYLHTTNP